MLVCRASIARDPGGVAESDDPDLEKEYGYLNQRFYARSPASYFTQRLNGLLVIAGADAEYGPKLREGIEALDMGYTVSAVELVESDLDDRELRAYITAESEVILHHITESMLRMLLAHLRGRRCPWLEIVRLRFPQFWTELDSYFDGSLPRARVERAFASIVIGFDHHADGLGITEDDFEHRVKCTYAWLSFFARELRDRGEVYNAAKHGFTVLADEAHFGVGEDLAAPFMTHTGPSLELLTYDQIDKNTKQWSSTTVWTNPVLSWFLTRVAADLLDAIWSVGRTRYVDEPLMSVHAPDFMPIDLQRALGLPGISRFRRSVFYETRSKT